jgi:acyl-CoA thioesterase I
MSGSVYPAKPLHYLAHLVEIMNRHWPENRTINVVCHGHSVPAGYFSTPMVDTFNAYPHLLHAGLKHRFPFAVINVIVTAIGGESSDSGADRFEQDVMSKRPDVVTIDYGLNDRGLGLERSGNAWRSMIEMALAADVRVLLLTPTADMTQHPDYLAEDRQLLGLHAKQIRDLAAEFGTGLVDSLSAFHSHMNNHDLSDLLSWANHPNRAGHDLIVRELLRWFPVAASPPE